MEADGTYATSLPFSKQDGNRGTNGWNSKEFHIPNIWLMTGNLENFLCREMYQNSPMLAVCQFYQVSLVALIPIQVEIGMVACLCVLDLKSYFENLWILHFGYIWIVDAQSSKMLIQSIPVF